MCHSKVVCLVVTGQQKEGVNQEETGQDTSHKDMFTVTYFPTKVSVTGTSQIATLADTSQVLASSVRVSFGLVIFLML